MQRSHENRVIRCGSILERWLVVVGALTALSGCAHARGSANEAPESPAVTGAGKHSSAAPPWQRTFEVAAQGVVELNVELSAGAAMTAEFSTNGEPLEWNAHSHPGDEVVMHAQGTDAAAQPRLVAEEAGIHSFLWKNGGERPVRLTVTLRIEGEGSLHSTDPP